MDNVIIHNNNNIHGRNAQRCMNSENMLNPLKDAISKATRVPLAPKREASQEMFPAEKKQKADIFSNAKPAFNVFCDDQPAQSSSSSGTDSGNASGGLKSQDVLSPLIRPPSSLMCRPPMQQNTPASDCMSISMDTDSVYASVDTSPSEYYTAPPDTPSQIHRDIVFCAHEYIKDIYEYLKIKETKYRAKPHYISKQSQLNVSMRLILIDWLVDVAQEYNLGEPTLHLAVSYVDRYLSLRDIPRDKLQLVGTVAIMIAAKYEEIYPPDLNEFVEVTDHTYTKNQVIRMERLMISDMKFMMGRVTCYDFMEMLVKKCCGSERTLQLARYLAELTLLDVAFLVPLPSLLGGAVVCLANLMTEYVAWPTQLEQESGLTLAIIYPVMKQLHAHLLKVTSHHEKFPSHAITDKYSDVRYLEVALIEPPETLPELNY